MMKRISGRILASLMTMIMVASPLWGGKAQATVVSPVGKKYADIFPDENLCKYVEKHFDTSTDGIISQSEFEKIYSTVFLELDDGTDGHCGIHIKDLTGLEYFVGLERLVCDKNELTELDLGENQNLKTIECRQNKLNKIDVSKNTNLTTLVCGDNELTELDVSKNSELEALYCYGNELTELDISKNPKLKYVNASYNKIKSIDLSNNPLLPYNTDECYFSKALAQRDTNRIEILTWGDKATHPGKFICLDVGTKVTPARYDSLFYDEAFRTYVQEQVCGDTSAFVSEEAMAKIKNCTSLDLKGLGISDMSGIENFTNLKFLDCSQNKFDTIDISYNRCLPYFDSNVTMQTQDNVKMWEKSENEAFYVNAKVKIIDNNYIPEPTPSNEPTPTPGEDPVPGGDPSGDPTTPTPSGDPTPSGEPTPTPSKAPELNVGDFVDRCYEVALGREADEDGYNYWKDMLVNGEACGAQVGYGFIFSGEYGNKNTTNEQFVTDMYAMFFGREADEEGYNYWLDMLNNETADRQTVFAGFANSQEFYNLCEKYGVVSGNYIVDVPNDQQGGVNCFVARLYKVCLNRLPDQGGQAGWVQKLMSGEVTGTTCAYGFVFSEEFTNLNLDNSDFVKYMYKAFFGREADEEGLNYWVEQLNNGTATREDIFAGFSGSAEFANLCAGYGINA